MCSRTTSPPPGRETNCVAMQNKEHRSMAIVDHTNACVTEEGRTGDLWKATGEFVPLPPAAGFPVLDQECS